MKFINRCVVTLKPKAELVNWVKGLGVEQPEVWNFEGGAYLLDECELEESLMQMINDNARTMLENELSVWTEDKSKWPKQRDFKIMEQWFDLYISIASFDLGKENLLRADATDLTQI